MLGPAAREAKEGARQRGLTLRWLGGVLVLLLCFTAYLDRIAFSVTASQLMKALDVGPVKFGLATTLFSVGYFVLQIPGAALVQRFGSRPVLALSLGLWSVFTALTGLARSFAGLAAVRFLFGMAEAPIFPGGNHFFAHWFKKEERGRANSLMNAGAFSASIFGPPVVVAVVAAFGWRSIYLVFAAFGIALALVWYASVRSRPDEHPWVGARERAELAADGVSDAGGSAAAAAPWRRFLGQRSFWMIAFGYFTTLWSIQFFIYWLPYFLQVTRKVSFKSLGFYASLPWISIVAAVLGAGVLSDLLLKRGFSRFASRNVVSAAGLAVAGAALAASTTAATALGNVLWISLALGMAGVAQTLSWAIATDIGQRFTSTVGGWMNTWGFIAASIVPTVAPIVAEKYGWNRVILLNAAITLCGVAAYLLVRTDEPLRTETAEG